MMRSSSPPHAGDGSGGCSVGEGGLNYFEHQVSKFDTLPGVAIKYGVEVADIKRLNGLVSDLQMFALKTLQIPLHGRHPPSPIVSNGQDTQGPSSSEKTPSSNRYPDLFGSFHSLKLTSSSQPRVSHYGGPKPEIQKLASEGFEMAVYRKGVSHYLEDGPFFKSTPHPNPPLSLHRKCKSVANDMSENGVLGNHLSQDSAENGSDRWFEKLSRRRQKSEADFSSRTPEVLLKKDNNSGSGFSAVAGKGLALRPKSASRTLSGPDTEASSINPIPIGLNDSLLNESTSVRKSSSTSSLQDSDSSGTLSSLWTTTKWNLKPDFQAISAAAITKPIFDSLPKPITARKSKTAVD
ncbi:PREDICTED: uncharacterized protein LOC109243404 [Nicotiana attenuata]|uniref:LysM domain-containing protein n=1 Tax=Nicotiana attenuata TaxID=49451 RepID=A0A1J6IKU1_NICAT|nr:PREDICTED: uncharacterized protein LOC109243404 [Nicotiana attenuata]OIT05470.1 hypothetical protein A4A49_33337 [Nicotiana attenuata]